CFGLMVPVGVAAFYLITNKLGKDDKELVDQLTGAALAFSAGTFLFVALSDLLPEVQFHRHDRIPLFLALTAGVAFMGFIALLESHKADLTAKGEIKADGTLEMKEKFNLPADFHPGPVEVTVKELEEQAAPDKAAGEPADKPLGHHKDGDRGKSN